MTSTAPRVLLVDDAFRLLLPAFRAVWPDTLDYAASFRDVAERSAAGQSWDAVFVDFLLGDDSQPGGLSVMRLLREAEQTRSTAADRAGRPTRLITFTGLSDAGGRHLAAAAAWHWFGAVTLDKTGDPQDLRRAADPNDNPMAPQLLKRMQSAHLVDRLFPDARALDLWRAYARQRGKADAIASALGVRFATVRAFYEAMETLPGEIDHALGQTSPIAREVFSTQAVDRRARPQGDLTAYASDNRLFFQLPGMETVLRHVRPWAHCH